MTHLNKVKLAHIPNAKHQAGIVMLITLIALVIMLLASIALIRSTDTNLLVSGHLSFKRDIVNQAERTIPVIKQLFSTTTSPAGVLSTAVSREQSIAASNYFATIQASNGFGIPTALLDTGSAVFTNAATTINAGGGSGVTIRYMIDRMCLTAGPANTTSCSISKSTSDPTGGKCPNGNCKPAGIDTPVYRISIRATGPRNTEAYIQSTFTVQ
jgi:type IV pilus assembly protein PilX